MQLRVVPEQSFPNKNEKLIVLKSHIYEYIRWGVVAVAAADDVKTNERKKRVMRARIPILSESVMKVQKRGKKREDPNGSI